LAETGQRVSEIPTRVAIIQRLLTCLRLTTASRRRRLRFNGVQAAHLPPQPVADNVAIQPLKKFEHFLKLFVFYFVIQSIMTYSSAIGKERVIFGNKRKTGGNT
jgi:hypothetical protein